MQNMSLDGKVSEWLLEYAYDGAKREFIETKKIENTISRNLIQGVLDQLQKYEDLSDRNACLELLLVIMCKLADGEDPTVEYEEEIEEGPQSAMEAVLERLDCLANAKDLSVDLTEFRSLVKQQAVFLLVRQGEFDMADIVAKRVFTRNISSEEKDYKRRTDDVLKARDQAHPFLSQYSYKKLLDVWLKVMKQLDKQLNLEKPFLIECAEFHNSLESKRKTTNQKCWEELDVIVGGSTLRQLQQKMGVQSLGKNAQEQWKKRIKNIQENRKEVLGRIHMIQENGEEDGNENVNNCSADSLIGAAHTLTEMSQVLERKHKSAAKHMQKKTTKTTKRNYANADSDEVEEEICIENTPMSRLPPRPASSKVRKSLAPVSPKKSRYNSLNISKLSNRSVGGHGRKPWEPYEEEALWEGIKEFGVGKWAQIKAMQSLPKRSSVDIKDKWRNIKKDKIKFYELAAKLGKLPDRKLKP